MNIEHTIWVKVKGYENYLVSINGDVLNIGGKRYYYSSQTDKLVSNTMNSRFLKPGHSQDYLAYSLCKESKVRKFRVHKLVCTHFLPNSGNKDQINHIDFNKHNNRLENLEWCTASENQRHSRKHKPYKTYNQYGSAFVPTLDLYNKAQELRAIKLGYKSIIKQLGISISNYYKLLNTYK